jgi:hypothetical protein
MATYYVSKRDGNNSNNGTSTRTPVADLWKGFELAEGSTGDTIEVIDSSVYYTTSASMDPAYPHGSDVPAFINLTVKAGTDPTTNQEGYPVISGKRTNESGSIGGEIAFKFQQGWTIQGFEIRDFSEAAAHPVVSNGYGSSTGHTTYGKPTLIIKDCLIHHIQDRNTGGHANGTINFTNDVGDEDTNVVENCIIYEVGLVAVGGVNQEDVTIRNSLIVNYGGAGNCAAIDLNSTGSVVEHCIIANQQSTHHNDSAVHLNGRGEIRFTIVSNVEGNNDGIFRANQITSCISHRSTRPGSGENITSGSSTYKLFNAAGGYTTHVDDCTADPNLNWNTGSNSNGYFDTGQNSISSEEIGNFLNPAGAGYPPFYPLGDAASNDGPNQASGSILTRDLADSKWFRSAFGYSGGRSRLSTAANRQPDIGCYEFYRYWSDDGAVTNRNIGDDFTINDGARDQIDKQFRVKLNDKEPTGQHQAPLSKTVKGPPSLRTLKRNSPYKLTKGS